MRRKAGPRTPQVEKPTGECIPWVAIGTSPKTRPQRWKRLKPSSPNYLHPGPFVLSHRDHEVLQVWNRAEFRPKLQPSRGGPTSPLEEKNSEERKTLPLVCLGRATRFAFRVQAVPAPDSAECVCRRPVSEHRHLCARWDTKKAKNDLN